MSENIGVVDWFTKKIKDVKYPEQSDAELDKLILQIIEIFDNASKMSVIADDLYDLFESSKFLNDISSDSRLPVCSLFHHIKNTSGIAVCLLLQKLDIDEKYGNKCLNEYGITIEYKYKDLVSLIRIAALLHDIGKPRSYTSSSKDKPYHFHTTQSREIVEQILERTKSSLVKEYELKKILPVLASKHHQRDVQTSFEKLLSMADTVASSADRVNEIEYEYTGNLLKVTNNDRIFPHEIDFNAGDLKCQNESYISILGNGQTESQNVESKDKNQNNPVLFYDTVSHVKPFYWPGKSSNLFGSIGLISVDIMGIQGFINEANKLQMLSGSSTIIENVLRCAETIIAKNICKEAILFSSAGNLLSFVPNPINFRKNLVEQIKRETKEISKGGLSVAVIHFEEQLSNIAKYFDNVLKNSQTRLDQEKNQNRERQIISIKRKVCEYCSKRIGYDTSGMCAVCKIKKEIAQTDKYSISKKFKIPSQFKIPTELNHIGDSIAVLIIDGNMMGKLFQQTKTPAEYNYKSQVFASKFDELLKQTIDDFCKDPNKLEMIKHEVEGNIYAGFVPIYVGGDDALIIMNAKGSLAFAKLLINNIADEFAFETKFNDGKIFKNHVVTASCGIAIADSKFPIYFLLNAAKEMESNAKKEFRKATHTNEFNIIELPKGSIALTAISSAMPGKQFVSFVINDKSKDQVKDNLSELLYLIEYSFTGNRSLVSEIITCGNSELERLNLIKFMYSSLKRKAYDIDECEWMTKILLDDELLNAARMIVPHLRNVKKGEII